MSKRILKIVMGIVGLVVFCILIPIILPAIDDVLTANTAPAFPGVDEFTGLVPLLAILGGLASSGFLVYSGIANKGSPTADLMRMIWGIIVIFVFLVLFPLIVSNMSTLYEAMNGTYTGAGVIPVIPLIIEVGSLAGGGLLMFQGAAGKGGGGKRHRHSRN